MQKQIGEFERRGAALVAIGQGTGSEAAHYAGKWGVEFPILGDREGRAYAAWGMLRGSWWTILFRAFLKDPVRTLQLMAKADLAGAALAASDVLRLGGVAIVEKGGRLRYLHRGQDPSDIPQNAEVLAALDTLRADPSRSERI